MKVKQSSENLQIPFLLAIVGGALVALFGASVLWGWYSHNVTLIQVKATFVPMQFNTALAMLFSGLGLLIVTRVRSGTGLIFGVFVISIGSAILMS